MIPYLLVALATLDAGPELHVVALHETPPKPAVVTVDRPNRDVVLIVGAYNPIEWDIRATPNTRLTKVVFGGYKRQSWKNLPGVDVQEMSIESAKQRILPLSLRPDYRPDSTQFRLFLQDSKRYTGLEVASFHGAYKYDPAKPIVVDAIQNDERLSSDFPRLSRATEIPPLKFLAARIEQTENGLEWRGTCSFTHGGPVAGTFVAFPGHIRCIASDAKSGQYYGVDGHNLFTVDLNRRTFAPVPDPAKVLHWGRALTYDAKRDRVIIVGQRGLYEFVNGPGGGWAKLADERFVHFAAVAWQAQTDTLYAFGVEDDRRSGDRNVPTLFRLNANGAIAARTPLAAPIFPALLGEYGRDGDAELIDSDGRLVLVVHAENRDGNGKIRKREAFLYAIDPKTGKAKLTWKE